MVLPFAFLLLPYKINGSSGFRVGDLSVDKLRIALKDNRLANNTVLKKLVLIADTVNTASEEALLKAFNEVLKMRDFYSTIDVDQYKSLISNEMQEILTSAQRSDSTLTDQDYSRLNRALLEAIYPLETRKTLIYHG